MPTAAHGVPWTPLFWVFVFALVSLCPPGALAPDYMPYQHCLLMVLTHHVHGSYMGSQGLQKVLPCSGHEENPDLGLNMPWSFSLRKFDQPFSKRVEPSLMQVSFLYKVHCVFFEVFVLFCF